MLKVNPDNKSSTITYTDYVEKHSDTSGSFFFYARIDFKNTLKRWGSSKSPLTTKQKFAGKVSFTGVVTEIQDFNKD